jgi:hypothetical protein
VEKKLRRNHDDRESICNKPRGSKALYNLKAVTVNGETYQLNNKDCLYIGVDMDFIDMKD